METIPATPSRCDEQEHEDREARQMSPQSAKSWGWGQNNLYREQPHETGGLLGVDVLKLSQELGMSLYQTHVQKNIFLNHVEAKKSW